jgi:hypothetical protein
MYALRLSETHAFWTTGQAGRRSLPACPEEESPCGVGRKGGAGAFAPVRLEVYNFEVSGLKVVQSWLGYRMRDPKGKKSSPLDDIRPEKWTGDFTTELLELLWILEAAIAEYPRQAKLLNAVAKGPKIRL